MIINIEYIFLSICLIYIYLIYKKILYYTTVQNGTKGKILDEETFLIKYCAFDIHIYTQ